VNVAASTGLVATSSPSRQVCSTTTLKRSLAPTSSLKSMSYLKISSVSVLIAFALRPCLRAERYSDPLTCLRVELDQHEAVLRDHGSEVATELMVAMREVVGNSIRKIDLVYRAGDGGYLLVLPNTHFPGALAVAERVARDIRKIRVAAIPELRASVSVGVSFFPNKDTHSLQDMLQLVDAALDRARGEGGGFVCLYQHQGYLYRPED